MVSDLEQAKYKGCLRGQRVAKPTVKTIRFHTSVNIMTYPTQCQLEIDVKKYVPLAMPSEWNVASILVRPCDDTDEAIFPVIGRYVAGNGSKRKPPSFTRASGTDTRVWDIPDKYCGR